MLAEETQKHWYRREIQRILWPGSSVFLLHHCSGFAVKLVAVAGLGDVTVYVCREPRGWFWLRPATPPAPSACFWLKVVVAGYREVMVVWEQVTQ